jgi:hypothetical protein
LRAIGPPYSSNGGKQQVFSLAIILVAPLLPLLLTVIPLEQMIDGIFGLLL